jgi:hypothetical protein
MKVTAHQTRLLGCYLDYNFLQVVDPSGLTVTESFFLETHANFTSSKKTTIDGVYFEGNVYATSGDSISIDPAFVDGSGENSPPPGIPPAHCILNTALLAMLWPDTIIANEINGGCRLKLTTSRKTVTHVLPSAMFEFDFSDVLLLPTIEEVMYSFTASAADSRWVAHSAMKQGKGVVVHFQTPVVGSVTVEVAQAVNGMNAPDH